MTTATTVPPWWGCFPAGCCGMLRNRDQDDNKLQTLAIYQPIKTK